MLRVILLLATFFPLTARAQEGILPCRPYIEDGVLVNPCTLMDAIILITRLINLGVAMAGTVAVIMVMLGGYQMAMAGLSGNSEGYTKGKQSVVNALMGLLLVMFSYAIVNSVMMLLFPGTFGNNWMNPWG